MFVKNIVLAIPMSTFNSATLAGSYLPVNAAGLPQACFLLRMVNASTTSVTISYDGGTTDHDVLPADSSGFSFLQIAAQTNSQPNNFTALFQKGLVVSVKGAAGVGNIYLVGYYQPAGNP